MFSSIANVSQMRTLSNSYPVKCKKCASNGAYQPLTCGTASLCCELTASRHQQCYSFVSMPTDLFTGDLSRLDSAELYAAIADFAATQPVEGWRHDYTEQWDDSSLKNVAAFAHTFGGMLIVGVKKDKRDRICELSGVVSETEYKTRIASSIASNISPVPSYDVFECHKPDAINRRFCLVRVRESKVLHLITKKGLQPVYVRNEDQVLPADAVQLRRLVDRERTVAETFGTLNERANQLRNVMVIGCDYKDTNSDAWQQSPHQSSQTFLKLMLVTAEKQPQELEKLHEDLLWKLIDQFYPRITECIRRGVALRADRRRMDFYEFSSYHVKLNYEMKWVVTNLGDVGFATQMDAGEKDWSVVDVTHYVVLLTRVAIAWWEFLGFFGEGHFYVQLNVPGLTLCRVKEGYYIQRFNTSSDRLQPRDIRKDAITLGTIPGNAATAEIKLNYFSSLNSLSVLTTSILNQLLRSLGHAVDRELLQKSVELIVRE